MGWKSTSISGVGYDKDSLKSSQCHLCRAVLSNKNALRYHLNYVHGIHNHGNHRLIESYHASITEQSSSPSGNTSSVVYSNKTQNNKQSVDTSNELTSKQSPVIKSEEK